MNRLHKAMHQLAHDMLLDAVTRHDWNLKLVGQELGLASGSISQYMNRYLKKEHEEAKLAGKVGR